MTNRKIAWIWGVVTLLAVALVLIVFQKTGILSEAPSSASFWETRAEGYSFARYEGDGPSGETYLACGSDGRLDRIRADGTVENIPTPTTNRLTYIWQAPNLTLLAGQSGALLVSEDGRTFVQGDGVPASDVLGLAYFAGRYYACTQSGHILQSEDGKKWETQKKLARTPLIAMAAGESHLFAITAETDIFVSTDGVSWSEKNFNEEYDGYYDPYVFTNMVNLGPTFFVLGHVRDDPGVPLAMYSDDGGEIWLFKSLTEIDNKAPQEHYPMNIYSVDVFAGELVGACDRGRLLTLAACSVCNTTSAFANTDFYSLASGSETLLLVGGAFAFTVLRESDIWTETISAGEALNKLIEGAALVDVRSEAEYDEAHINASVSIPLAELEQRLPAAFPDGAVELIFYGANAMDAQAAKEIAEQLGYTAVYNLGALSDWPYETGEGGFGAR